MATYYLDATSGSDAANGTTTGTPWKTFNRIAGVHFVAGDQILLKRGEKWRETFSLDSASQGAAGNPIIVGAYGTGAKPIIDGGVVLSATTTWADQGSNMWRAGAAYGDTPVALTKAIGNVLFNGETSIGVWRASAVACVAQGDYYYDAAADYLNMYSVGNPGTFYTSIEASQYQSCNIHDVNWVTVQNIVFQYWGLYALLLGHGNPGGSGTNTGQIVENCDLRWNGGSYHATTGARDGYHLYITAGISNAHIRYNTFFNGYNPDISVECETTNSLMENIYIHHNIFRDSHHVIDFWLKNDASCVMNNLRFCHNVIYNVGGGLQAAQRAAYPTPFLWYNYGTVTNSYYCNNIHHTLSALAGARWVNTLTSVDMSGMTMNNNCWYPEGTTKFYYQGTGYSFANWKTNSGKDSASTVADPLLVDPAASDFHLTNATSPCYDTGVAVTGVGQAVIGAGPDMGVYEYPFASINKLCPFKKV